MTRDASQVPRRVGRAWPRAVGWLILAWISSGCALVPKLGPPPHVGPPYIPPPEPVWVVLDPALFQSPDSTRPAAPTRRSPSRARPTDIGPSPNPSEPSAATTSAPPTSGGLPDASLAGAPDAPGTAPALSIDLPSSDRWQLSDAAHRNLSAADSLSRGAERTRLSPRDRAKLENARGLMRQAEEALTRGDLRAAANLAYKARLLAAEVAR